MQKPNYSALAGALTRVVIAMALGLGFVSLGQAQTTKSVAITSIVEHPALNDIRDGVKDELKEAGWVAGENLKWEFQSAQGNPGIAAQIARKFIGSRPDVIVAIATPSAQALVAASKTIPVVYSGVTDPIAAQLVKTWEASGTNVSGVSDMLDLKKQIAFIQKMVPHAKRVGIIYNPGEANSAVVVQALKQLLNQHNMSLVTAAAPRTVDVGAAAKSLIGKVDVIYSNTDNNVVSVYETLAKVANDAKIPLIASDTGSVQRGAAAALGISYYNLGRQTGKMVLRILKGEKPGDIASENLNELDVVINRQAAEKQGVDISAELLKSAKKIF